MILHVLADAGQRVMGFDADLREMLGIANPGQLQQMRRAHRAGRQDHLALGEDPLDPTLTGKIDPDRALAVEYDAVHQRVGNELQIGTLQGRPQIGPGGAGAAAAAARLLAPTDAGTGAGRQVVDILAVFEPELHAGLDHLRANRGAVHSRGVQVPLRAVDLARTFPPTLGFLEKRQAIVP